MGLARRAGAAIADPRAALAAADGGDGGAPDALRLLLLKFVATEARTIVAALWATLVNGPSVGLPPLLSRLSAAVGIDLLMILIAGVVITIGAGRKRSSSRDFDLAVVAWIPVLLVSGAASLVQVAFDFRLPDVAAYAITTVALLWMLSLVALAIRTARQRSVPAPGPIPKPESRKSTLAGAVLLAVLYSILATNMLFVLRHGDQLRPLRPGDVAPASFTVRGANVPGFGSLTVLRGHVVLIDFWAHWCGPCREGMPHLQRLYAKHHGAGFEILSINVHQDRSEAGVRQVLEQAGVTFPVYYDDGTAQALYNAYSLPTMVLIDKRGFIRDAHAERRPRDLDARITQLLAEP